MRSRLALALAIVGLQCGHTREPYSVVSAPRGWAEHPAIVEMGAVPTLYAISDVHGGYERMVTLLAAHHVIAAHPPAPDAAQWTGGTAVLVVIGDIFDKGAAPLEALDLLRTLEPRAATAGGRVIFTLGNHEAEFLDDPENDKATKDHGVDEEIRTRGLAPVDIASGKDPRGAWLRDRPFGAKVGSWFFAHAGNTHGRSLPDLEAALRTGVGANDYHDDEIIGGESLLESRGWYAGDDATAMRYGAALGAKHIVFGHQPDALGPRGQIAVAYAGALFRIDCGMSPDVDDSQGRMLRVRREEALEIAESLDPEGSAHEVWRGE
jgi:hypothetical protein